MFVAFEGSYRIAEMWMFLFSGAAIKLKMLLSADVKRPDSFWPASLRSYNTDHMQSMIFSINFFDRKKMIF